MRFTFKGVFIKLLEFLKSTINFNTSIVLFSCLLLCEIFCFNRLFYIELVTIPFSIFISYFYIILFYFILNSKKAKQLLKYKKIFKYYKTKNTNYFEKQFKDVFVEEIVIRYMPYLMMLYIYPFNIYLTIIIIIVITFLFTIIHEFNHWFLLIEFFLFFIFIFILFAITKSFSILFFPHLIRNLLIQYLLKNQRA